MLAKQKINPFRNDFFWSLHQTKNLFYRRNRRPAACPRDPERIDIPWIPRINRGTTRIAFSAVLFSILIFPMLAIAELPSDKNAKLFIASNTAELNKETGISIFTGDVKIDHGSTHVTADKLTTYSDEKSHVVKAIAVGKAGNIATYESMTDVGKPPLVATAETIEYYPQKHYVILLGNAHVTQGENSIAGPHLEYDLEKQLLVTKTDSQKSKGRTEIIIQPNKLEASK